MARRHLSEGCIRCYQPSLALLSGSCGWSPQLLVAGAAKLVAHAFTGLPVHGAEAAHGAWLLACNARDQPYCRLISPLSVQALRAGVSSCSRAFVAVLIQRGSGSSGFSS